MAPLHIDSPSRFDWQQWHTLMTATQVELLIPKQYNTVANGLQYGFDLQIDDSRSFSRPGPNYIRDAVDEEVIDTYLKTGIEQGRIVGPFNTKDDASNWLKAPLRVNPLFIVWSGGRLRPVCNFSSPKKGTSVNSAIYDDWATAQYVSLRRQVQAFSKAGKGSYIWLVDAKDAYLQLKVKPQQHKWLGFYWRQRFYHFNVMMLGLASAPQIYTDFGDCILTMLARLFPDLYILDAMLLLMHYIDDFFGVHPDKEIARRQCQQLIALFNKLNVPYKEDKKSEPSQLTKVLGWLHDTIRMGFSIPQNKLDKMMEDIAKTIAAQKVTQSELLSLCGKLRWASAVVFGGPHFIRSLELAAHTVTELRFRVRVTAQMRTDLRFWQEILPTASAFCPWSWILRDPQAHLDELSACTDAAGLTGLGACVSDGTFWRIRWTELWSTDAKIDIYLGETIAAVLAIDYAASLGKNLRLWVDNENTHFALLKKRCKTERHDIRRLIEFACRRATTARIRWSIDYLPTDHNVIADALSRFKTLLPSMISKQPAVYGNYTLQKQKATKDVKETIIDILGNLYNTVSPPTLSKT